MKRATARGPEVSDPPKVRRGYFECRFGQLHVRNAMPPGGGFDEATPLLCLHGTASSGRTFEPALGIMGRDRSAYAPDLPGFGESDLPARPSVADYAAAIGDFLDAMRFRQIDILGQQLGAVLAVELALQRAQQVRRLVLVSLPLLPEGEREAFRRQVASSAPAEDGNHLVTEWRRSLETLSRGASLEVLATRFAEKLANAPAAAAASQSLGQYALRERLTALTQPVMMVRPRDELWEAMARARELLPRARLLELPEHGYALFDVAPQAVTDPIREFLRG